MPLIIAVVVLGGTFFGYVAHETRPDKNVVAYYKAPVTRSHVPYFDITRPLDVKPDVAPMSYLGQAQ